MRTRNRKPPEQTLESNRTIRNTKLDLMPIECVACRDWRPALKLAGELVGIDGSFPSQAYFIASI
jgi:hypothetical protein